MRLRKNRRHVHASLEEAAEPESGNYSPKDLADWREIPSETLERSELRSALRRAIAALPRTSREVILLRDVHKLSTSETASILGTSVVAVKSRLLRARLQVRDALAPGIDGAWSLGETKWRRVRAW
jgi:RNA polymerase sigma-70 factor (ECF subfamily)